MAGLDDKLLRKDMAKLRAYVAQGMSLIEIAESEAGWTPEWIADLHGRVLIEEEGAQVGRRTEEVFADYTIRTRANIRQLDEIIEDLKSSKQGSALVGAVKAKQDLMDRVIERGQTFGLIERKPDQRTILIAKMGDEELRRVLADEIAAMRGLMDGAGSSTHLLDMDAVDVTATVRPAKPAPAAHDSGFAPPKAPRRVEIPDASPPTPGVIRRRAIAPAGAAAPATTTRGD